MSQDKRFPESVSRVVFERPVRFPDAHGTELSSWSREHHSSRCTCEMSAGGSVVLRGPRGSTVVPSSRVMYLEAWTE